MDSWFSSSVLSDDDEKSEDVLARQLEERLKRRREVEVEKQNRKKKRREAVLSSIRDEDEEDVIVIDDEEEVVETRALKTTITTASPNILSEVAQHAIEAFRIAHPEQTAFVRKIKSGSMTTQQLRLELKKRNLSTKGNKKTLSERLCVEGCVLPIITPPQQSSEILERSKKEEAYDIFKPVKIDRKGKRETRYRGTPSQAVIARIQRARSQRLYFVTWKPSSVFGGTFVVLGSTGNVYNVTIGHINTCTCPDSRKGNHCKHLLFVLLKVLQEPPSSPIVWQRGFTNQELEILNERLKKLTERRMLCLNVVANDAVKHAYDQSTGKTTTTIKQRPLTENSECVICCEPLRSGTRDEPLVWCKQRCGNSLHEKCMGMWIMQSQRDNSPGAEVPCPFCRVSWQNTGTHSTATGDEGYLNLAAQSGQTSSRPSSYTPYNWRRGRSKGGWRRRYY